MSLLARIASLFERARRDHELDEEIRAHLRMAVEERVARGEPRQEAERAVRREFGDPRRVKEVTRTMWRGAWFERLCRDLRFGARSLRRDRGYVWTAAAVLTIGIGANAAVFTLANALLLQDAPGVSDPDELVGVRWLFESDGESTWAHTDYAYLRDEATAFDGVLAYLAEPIPVTTSDEVGSRADAWVVSESFFGVLGTEMALGRGFIAEEAQTPGTHPVVVISNAFWQSRLGADPAVLGRTLPVNGTPFTIVGVTPRGFRGMSPIEPPPDLYVPVMMQGAVIPGSESWLERVEGSFSGWLRLVARLSDGMTVAGAQASLESVQAGWHETFGAWQAASQRPDFRMVVTREYKLNAEDAQRLRRMLVFLAMIAAAILVIGSANVAILMLARGAARRAEIGLRTALGAGRARLFAQLLTENLIVAVLGGLGGLCVAYLAARAAVPLLPYELSSSLAPDVTVLAFTGAVTLVVTLLFGVVPAVRLSVADVGPSTRHTTRVTNGNGLRNVLVVGQVAGALVLVVGAGLFVRSVVAAQSVDVGFEPDGRLAIATELAIHGYDDARGIAFVNETLERARALPGVARATVAARVPFRGGRSDEGVRVPGTQLADRPTVLNFNWVGPDYFETMGIALAAGRAIEAYDDVDSGRVLVVNETTAARLWPSGNALGRTIVRRGETWTVVGVAADASYYALGEAPVSQVYVPIAQEFIPYPTFLLETRTPPETVAPAMTAAIRDLDARLTISGVQSLRDLVDAQSASFRLLAVVGGAFGLVALVLAVTGLYGVQSYLVGQRFKEIGIRMALGAQSRQVSGHILRHGARLAAIGVALGLPIAFAAGRTIEGMLFGVQARDPLTLSGVAAVLLVTSMAASYVPARRAGRMDPMAVLRDD